MQRKKNKTTENEEKQEPKQGKEHGIPLMALNHVSRVCRSVKDSVDFYTKVLGFVLIERPEAFDFDGAWLFNYGVGIHLVHAKDEQKLPHHRENLDPTDNHISFQGRTQTFSVGGTIKHSKSDEKIKCENMEAMDKKLKDHNIKYIKRTVGDEDEGAIDQLFFNDPDGFMIEICNCENLKLIPQGSLGRIKLPFDRHNSPVKLDDKAGD